MESSLGKKIVGEEEEGGMPGRNEYEDATRAAFLGLNYFGMYPYFECSGLSPPPPPPPPGLINDKKSGASQPDGPPNHRFALPEAIVLRSRSRNASHVELSAGNHRYMERERGGYGEVWRRRDQEGVEGPAYPQVQAAPLDLSIPKGHIDYPAGDSSSTLLTDDPWKSKLEEAFPTLRTHPVEFCNAVEYVGDIRKRFGSEAGGTYYQFLDILDPLKKRDGNSPSDAEICKRVTKLFENHEDLIKGFGNFLPAGTTLEDVIAVKSKVNPVVDKEPAKNISRPKLKGRKKNESKVEPVTPSNPKGYPLKVAPSNTHLSERRAPKRPKWTCPILEIKPPSDEDSKEKQNIVFLDKLRCVVKSKDGYETCLRCLSLYHWHVLSKEELVMLVKPYFYQTPEFLEVFLDNFIPTCNVTLPFPELGPPVDKINENEPLVEIQIDSRACERIGVSYCVLPKDYIPPTCAGQTELCAQVLNDAFVAIPPSFPNSSCISGMSKGRRSSFEEFACYSEDERYEVDVLIETNSAAVVSFEKAVLMMSRMSEEELEKFELDESLGGSSGALHQGVVRRLYGDRAPDVIEGLMKRPYIAVPIVLKRLKDKHEEWREAQRNYNKIYREHANRYCIEVYENSEHSADEG